MGRLTYSVGLSLSVLLMSKLALAAGDHAASANDLEVAGKPVCGCDARERTCFVTGFATADNVEGLAGLRIDILDLSDWHHPIVASTTTDESGAYTVENIPLPAGRDAQHPWRLKEQPVIHAYALRLLTRPVAVCRFVNVDVGNLESKPRI